MSADNTVWVRKLASGKYAFRDISSLYPEDLTDSEVDREVGKSRERYASLGEALAAAHRYLSDCERTGHYVEYGVMVVARTDECRSCNPSLDGDLCSSCVVLEEA